MDELTFKKISDSTPQEKEDYGSKSYLYILNDGTDFLGYWNGLKEGFMCPEWGEFHHKSEVALWIDMTELKLNLINT